MQNHTTSNDATLDKPAIRLMKLGLITVGPLVLFVVLSMAFYEVIAPLNLMLGGPTPTSTIASFFVGIRLYIKVMLLISTSLTASAGLTNLVRRAHSHRYTVQMLTLSAATLGLFYIITTTTATLA